MAKCHPEVTVGVDRHAVWGASVTVITSIDRDGGVADRAAGVVVIVGADLLGHGVDVIHRGGIGAPANAVRIGHLVDFMLQRAVGIEHVEVGVADVFNQAEGACPEAARGVAFAVVETVGRAFFGLGVG